MSFFLKELKKVHGKVQNSHMGKKYTNPKIYHGGKDYDLSKPWYVYFNHINEHGEMERVPNIKMGVNRLKTKKARLKELKLMKKSIVELLKNGVNPFQDRIETEIYETESALDFALNLKKQSVAASTYDDYESRLVAFKKYLNRKSLLKGNIRLVTKRHVIDYLNQVLKTSSPRNRNNFRIVLSSLFSVLEDNEIIERNFIRSIKPLKTNPTRNKTYTQKQADEIFDWLEENNPHFLLFIKFVSYGFLRPIEVCRLKVGDINFNQKTLTVRAKNKTLKTKTIPDLLLSEIEFLKRHDNKHWIFTPEGVGNSKTTEKNRRDYFSKQFLKVKKKLGLGIDYTMYSFRHTFTTKVYRELRKQYSPHQAKSELMLITGHSTMSALEKYLRDIDAELPEDYSDML